MPYEKIRTQYGIKFVHLRLDLQENRVLKFIKHILKYATNNRQQVILRAKISGKSRIKYFLEALCFRKNKFEKLSYACKY